VVNPKPPEPTERDLILAELEAEEELLRRLEYDKAAQLGPNPTQWSFGNHGPEIHESMFCGPNQCGKTSAVRYIAQMHMTGRYEDGWTGPRFDHPIQCVLAGETAETVRDLLVNELLGTPTARGSGYLPEDTFDHKKDIKRMGGGGVPDQVSYFRVRHETNGIFDGYSVVYCSQYSKGWQRFQGYALNLIIIDEEPPFDVYDELSARINKTGGYMYICLTPLQGETDLYVLFERDTTGERRLIHYDIDDATHMTVEERDRLKKKYEHHPLREARLHGRPVRGRGLIFPVAEERWVIDDDPQVLAHHWSRIIGIDIPHGAGFFAGVKLVYDEDHDIVVAVGEYKDEGQPWPVYESRLRGMGGKVVPVAWPHDANVRGTDGRTGRERLEGAGLNVLPEAAAYLTYDGKLTNKIWSAIEDVLDRMQTGRFKCFRSLTLLRDEIRTYKQEDGKIVALQDDHLLDGLFKGMMMLRHAEPELEQYSGDGVHEWAESWEDYDFYG